MLVLCFAPPCFGKAVIQRWQRETPEASPAPQSEDPVFPSIPRPSSAIPVPEAKPRQSVAGLSMGYYGAKPAVLLKGIFWEQALSDTFRFRGCLQSGNTLLTSGDIREYSSFVRVPLSLTARFPWCSLGIQYTNTLVSTYEKPSYAMSAFEPLIGLGGEWGGLSFGIDATMPLLESLMPPVCSFHFGVIF